MSAPNHDPTRGTLLEHEYDGIREYDNPMPGWWIALFALSVVFAVAYPLWLWSGDDDKSILAEYESEVATARALELKNAPPALAEADLAAVLAVPEVVAAGGAKFREVCAACHGEKAEGKIGPNLTDKFWLHGKGNLQDIYQVIAKGVPEKGMPTWARVLKAEELKNVAVFVGSIRNTQVAGKAPQGQAVEPALELPQATSPPAPVP